MLINDKLRSLWHLIAWIEIALVSIVADRLQIEQLSFLQYSCVPTVDHGPTLQRYPCFHDFGIIEKQDCLGIQRLHGISKYTVRYLLGGSVVNK